MGAFLVHQVGGVGAGLAHHLLQTVGVVEDGAGAQVVAVEGLLVVVGHEEGRAQRVEQAHVADVDVGVVGEHAGLHVAASVDVQVAPAAGDAAAHELAVVPEVEREQGFLLTHRAHVLVELGTLLGRGHEVGGGVGAHGHVGEDPAEEGTLFNHPVKVFLRAHGTGVLAGKAGGDAERQTVLAQQLHAVLDALVGSLAAAGVGCLLEALGADGGDEVLDLDHVLAELLVDERGVGEAQKRAVGVLAAQRDDVVLAHERLAARVDIDVHAELFALADDGVDVLEREVELVAVVCGPAAQAMQVTGARGVEQDGPGDVATVLGAHLLLLAPGQYVRVNHEGLEQAADHIGVEMGDFENQLIPVGLVLNGV